MRIAVIIPYYRRELSWSERISLQQAMHTFVHGGETICFLLPEGMETPYARALPNGREIPFPRKYFADMKSYNELMLHPAFYQRFLAYDYILIYQLDAFAFYDRLDYFASLGYDYIGAPWCVVGWRTIRGKRHVLHVGNGGFSLRNPRACRELLLRYRGELESWGQESEGWRSEDNFFSFYGGKKENAFRLAPIGIARQFACEVDAERVFRKNGQRLPMGCHAWTRFSAAFYEWAFAQVGLDLAPYRSRMQSLDTAAKQSRFETYARIRLYRRLDARRPLVRYLPPGRRWSLHIWGADAREAGQALLREGLAVTPHVYVYDDGDGEALARNLADGREAGQTALLLSLQDAAMALAHGERQGLRYGRDMVSFWREYLQRLTHLVRRMSRSPQ